MIKRIGWSWLVLLLTACSTGIASPNASSPLPWRVGYFAPDYMSAWVEESIALDTQGRAFNTGGGVVAIHYARDPAGWPERVIGIGRHITGAELPARIYVRWQSLVEPQTYEVTLMIPDEVRRLMRQREPQPRHLPEQRLQYRNQLIVGLAPGGAVKIWNSGVGLDPIEVMCLQASVVAEGPDGGRHGGRYVTLPEQARAYVDAHPIPYDSWKCGNG